MKRCPVDHSQFFDSQKFCTDCGARLVSALQCENGHDVSRLDRFCGQCGVAVNRVPAGV